MSLGATGGLPSAAQCVFLEKPELRSRREAASPRVFALHVIMYFCKCLSAEEGWRTFFSDRFFLAQCARRGRKKPLETLGESSRYSSFFLKASQTPWLAGFYFMFSFLFSFFSILFLALRSQIGDAIQRLFFTRAWQRDFPGCGSVDYERPMPGD